MKTALLAKCADMFGVTTDDILSMRRGQNTLAARRAFYLAMRRRGWSFKAIGKFMGRDHTTIITGARNAAEQASYCAAYAEKIRELAEFERVVKPEPKRTGRPRKYDFDKMFVGDVFTLPLKGERGTHGSDEVVDKLRDAAVAYGRKTGKKFLVRTDRKNGVARCWRVK
ncbi:Chromosomal replication initiator, DnaA C-terminal [uncultured Caudovirales phage]|uniref:Chromosomal replication initiator, DnaA C-terminal n=1 Tax=uncultured Caudovirales phage TaxID=2100421 RepID=A0A6J5LYA9_9CAUD|nr:Chromosomal replication initiator, DnaA C-terminal [uncultured Caudovirales phage]